MYTVRIDVDLSLIDAVLAGSLSAADVQGYVKEVQTALIMNQFRGGYALIVDVSDCAIQPHATIAAFAQHMAAMPKARRIGVVVGHTPAIDQVRRLFTQDYARLVQTHRQGRDWVLSASDPNSGEMAGGAGSLSGPRADRVPSHRAGDDTWESRAHDRVSQQR